MSRLLVLMMIGILLSMQSLLAQIDTIDSMQIGANSYFNLGLHLGYSVMHSKANSQYLNFLQALEIGKGGEVMESIGEGNSFGISFETAIGNPASSPVSIIARVNRSTYSQSFRTLVDYSLSRTSYGQIVRTDLFSDANSSFEIYNCDILVRYKIRNTKLGVHMGPQLSYTSGSTHKLKAELVNYNGYTTSFTFGTIPGSRLLDILPDSPMINGYWPRYDGYSDKSIIMYEGELPTINSLRWSLIFGIDYEIVDGPVDIVPFINYNLGITPMVNVDTWDIQLLQTGIEFRIAL